MLWSTRDSFRSETAPKIVTASAFGRGKREAQAGADSSRALLLVMPGDRAPVLGAASSRDSFVAFQVLQQFPG